MLNRGKTQSTRSFYTELILKLNQDFFAKPQKIPVYRCNKASIKSLKLFSINSLKFFYLGGIELPADHE